MQTLNDLLDSAAIEAGDAPALVTADETITYSELHARVLKATAGFNAAGIKSGDCIAILHRNSPFFIEAYFALVRLGAVAVPLNFMIQKSDELAYMLNDCKAVGVVTQKQFLKGLRVAAEKTPTLRDIWVTDDEQDNGKEKAYHILREQTAYEQVSAAAPADTASILYTSGTTGNPKGVMLTHRNFVTNAAAGIERMEATRDDCVLCILPMFHSFGWTGNVLVALMLRTKLVISASIAPAKPWLDLMAKHGVSVFSAVPQVYSLLAKQCVGFRGLALRYWYFRKVRIAVSGAAPLSKGAAEEFKKAFGLPILEGYGLTETTPIATINPPRNPKPGSVGTPVRGVEVEVIDEEERPLAAGAEGELCVRGDCVMKGYFNLPQATADAFTKDGWLKTGDVAAIDSEGYVFIRDRKKDMIIIKGLKVFSAQVETVLLEHPAVEEAAIIGIPDEHGDETIKAFIVLKSGATEGKSELMHYCRQKFDAYKRPRDIEIVDCLPKNALQKVLKRDLRKRELDKRAQASS